MNRELSGFVADSERFFAFWRRAFHGDQDTICPLKGDEEMINALRAQGALPRFTVLPGKGHYIGEEAYNNPKLYDWFLENTRQH